MSSLTADLPGVRAKQQGVALLRATRLLPMADWLRFWLHMARARKENAAFLATYPDYVPPPAAVMYDAYGHTSIPTYHHSGGWDADTVTYAIRRHHPHAKTVLEWGCGPARVLRHLPARLPGVSFWGADINARSIGWCAGALPGMTFTVNADFPPLPFAGPFDVIYAISVMTHLSVPQQDAWAQALRALLAPGGLLILTTHGQACATRLLPEEQRAFEEDGVVVRGNVVRGTRCFVAYHHPDYVRARLLDGLTVLDHMPDNPSPHAIQDVWVAQGSTPA